MFSTKERNFLENNSNYSRSYGYVIGHRIKKKLQQFYRLELPLIEQSPNLTEFHKNFTEKISFERDLNP